MLATLRNLIRLRYYSLSFFSDFCIEQALEKGPRLNLRMRYCHYSGEKEHFVDALKAIMTILINISCE